MFAGKKKNQTLPVLNLMSVPCQFKPENLLLKCLTKIPLHAGIIWRDVLLMDDVLHEAALSDYSLEVSLK